MLNKRGFTIGEVIVAAFIGMIVVAAAIGLHFMAQESLSLGVAFLEIHSEARISMDYMARDIRWATRVMPASTTTTLVLEVPSIDGAGYIIDIDDTYDYITYSLNPGNPQQLLRGIAANVVSSRVSGANAIAENVTGLAFDSNGTPLSGVGSLPAVTSVGISLTTSRNILGAWDLQETKVSAINLRNK